MATCMKEIRGTFTDLLDSSSGQVAPFTAIMKLLWLVEDSAHFDIAAPPHRHTRTLIPLDNAASTTPSHPGRHCLPHHVADLQDRDGHIRSSARFGGPVPSGHVGRAEGNALKGRSAQGQPARAPTMRWVARTSRPWGQEHKSRRLSRRGLQRWRRKAGDKLLLSMGDFSSAQIGTPMERFAAMDVSSRREIPAWAHHHVRRHPVAAGSPLAGAILDHCPTDLSGIREQRCPGRSRTRGHALS